MAATTRLIDRTTDHLCPDLARDLAYFADQGRSYYACGWSNNCPPITVHYAQWPAICADCRRECLDDSLVKEAACVYCSEILA